MENGRRSAITFIIILLILLAAVFVYHYVFGIYETVYTAEPKEVSAGSKTIITVKSVPLNSFGWKAPLRFSPVDFRIIEGKDLIEIVEKNYDGGILRLRAKESAGTVVIYAKSPKALLPSEIRINILSNLAVK